VAGSVTKFGTERSSKGVGGGGFGVGGFGLGSVGTSKGKANVAITARIIDVETGEIMASAKGDGTSKRSGFLLGGAGGGSGGGGGGMINFSSSDFRDTILGEATETAVKATVAKLVAARTRLQ
jgi:curli biogenesis system outer membrane secretion channel CsgG